MTRTCPSALLPFRHRFACCDEARRRPTTRASASRYSAAHERLSRGRFRGPCGRRPQLERRGCSSPTSATDLRHVHLLSIARFPVCSSTFASAHHPTELPLPDTPGRLALDDAIRASVDPSLTRAAIWRSRAPLNPGGLRYRRALEGASPVPRRCLPRARSARRPLTPPVATSSGAFARAARRQDRLSPEPRQGP